LADKATVWVRILFGEKLTDADWPPFVHDLEHLIGETLSDDDLAAMRTAAATYQ
jgi:hypothetical protein